MIKSALQKHVTLGINNGVVIEGFVQSSDEKYFKVVEKNNNEVIVRIDDVSFVRVAQCEQEVCCDQEKSHKRVYYSGKADENGNLMHPSYGGIADFDNDLSINKTAVQSNSNGTYFNNDFSMPAPGSAESATAVYRKPEFVRVSRK